MDPPPPPSREEAPAQAEKRPLDAAAAEAETAETAAKKQRLADPSSPIDPKDVEGLKDNDRQEAIAAREAEAKAKIQAEAERRERERAEQAAAAEAAKLLLLQRRLAPRDAPDERFRGRRRDAQEGLAALRLRPPRHEARGRLRPPRLLLALGADGSQRKYYFKW